MCSPIEHRRKELHSIAGHVQSGTPLWSTYIPYEEENGDIRRTVLEERKECCSICFESHIIQPVVLKKCHHVYCFACLQNWNTAQVQARSRLGLNNNNNNNNDNGGSGSTMTTPTCPLCCQEIPDMAESIIQEIVLFVCSAQKESASQSFIEEQSSKAYEKMELLQQIIDSLKTTNPTEKLRYETQLNDFRFNLHMVKKEYSQAIQVGKESEQKLWSGVQNTKAIQKLYHRIKNLPNEMDEEEDDEEEGMELRTLSEMENIRKEIDRLEEYPISYPIIHVGTALQIANVQILQEDWVGAKRTYKQIMKQYDDGWKMSPDIIPQQRRDIFGGMAQCSYELHEYAVAITVGQASISMNRYYPNSHSPIIQSYLILPDHKHIAQKYAAQAIIYEAPHAFV